ncbi:MAG: FGLLP motif-containing membrane protein [Candidatus Dormiibacterota bacterium]
MTGLLRRLAAVIAATAIGVGVSTIVVDAAGLPSLVSGHFTAVPKDQLPAGATYDDATCPSESQCYGVGTGSTGGVITTTANGGRSWSSKSLPDTAGVTDFAISCPSASDCYVAGSAGTTSVMLATRNSGRTWARQTVPDPSVITSIGCATPAACVAVGSNLQAAASTVLSTTDGGTSWVQQASPTADFTTVRCLDLTHCWAAGSGAWFSADLGASWVDRSPPSTTDCPTRTGFGLCSLNYSETIDIEFQSVNDGWVVGGNQCGGEGVTQCPGVAYRTTDGGATWAASPGSTRYPFNWQIACQGNACILVGQAFSGSVIAATGDSGSTWHEMQAVPSLVNALACTPLRDFCIAAGGEGGVAVLLTLGTPAPAPSPAPVASLLSSVATALATPAQLLAAPTSALVNALIAVALILLITFPSQLFNRTYDENQELIRKWWEAHLPGVKRLTEQGQRLGGGWRATISALLVLILGAALATLLDPGAGPNLRSLALFLGAALAITCGVAVTGVAGGAYRALRHKVGDWHIRALPSALLVAGLCVLISRLTAFEPGYLYGVIGGVAFTGRLSKHEEGHEVAVAVLCTLAVSIAAWLVWVPVTSAAQAHPSSFVWALLDNFLAALFLSGMVGLVVGLVPLRFLPGARLKAWHLGAWTATFGVVILAVLEVILQPQTHASRGGVAPSWTTLALFLGFGAASVSFWIAFRKQDLGPTSVAAHLQPAAEVPAPGPEPPPSHA